ARLPALDDARLRERVRRVAVASDFFVDTCTRQPGLLETLARDDGATALPPPVLEPGQREEWMRQLRRYRCAESARLVWRDVLGLDDVDATLAGTTALAERCLQAALAALEEEF